ncbi:DUF4232 domain-containing protein [Streptomyces sp. HUAS ZL42]|uniref:DUF4232 domain-containing protein n=1 Tax=Streptomyces sp. HUAS ZL42 TaxID=3231715 RepID=UPI00345F1062
MNRTTTVRKAALATAALSAILSVTACRPGDTPSPADSPSKAPTSTAPSTPSSSAPSSATASPTSGSASTGEAATKKCTATALEAAASQAADRPDGTGIGAAIVEFKNTSAQPCTLQGHPTVAGAGNGSPEKNAPLKVTPEGSASPVLLAPGGKAWVKLTFVQVQGEGDGYCESGAEPVAYPTLVVGLPGAGAHQVALEDGLFAECDNTVAATAVSATKLS